MLRLRRNEHRLAHQNEALATVRAAQDQLYALVAHDLRSPVVAFMGLAYLLNYYVQRQDTAQLAGLAGRVHQAAQSLSHLLDNLLSWVLTQRAALVPRPETLGAAELLTDVTTLYQNAATAAYVTLTADAPPGLTRRADGNMTRTILRNLVSNTLKATPAGGRVVIRALLTNTPSVLFRISDTGPGLDATVRAQLSAPPPALPLPLPAAPGGLGLLVNRAFAAVQGGQLLLTGRAAAP